MDVFGHAVTNMKTDGQGRDHGDNQSLLVRSWICVRNDIGV